MKQTIWTKQNLKIWIELGMAAMLITFTSLYGLQAEGEKTQATPNKQVSLEQQAAEENTHALTNTEKETKQNANSTTDSSEVSAGQYPIMGTSAVSVEQMVKYFATANVPYPSEILAEGGADSIETFCQMYYEEAAAEGVRAEVAFAQTMKETGWLQYGGDASAEQFNFAGLGTTGGGVPGNSYPDVRTGIRAQIQHLKAYATEDVLSQACVDDRYEYVLKGCSPYVEWLGQQENPQGTGWATAKNYGPSIVSMIQQMNNL